MTIVVENISRKGLFVIKSPYISFFNAGGAKYNLFYQILVLYQALSVTPGVFRNAPIP